MKRVTLDLASLPSYLKHFHQLKWYGPSVVKSKPLNEGEANTRSGKDVQERPGPAAKPPVGGAEMVQQDSGESRCSAIHGIRIFGGASEERDCSSGRCSRAEGEAGSKNEAGHAANR